MNLIEEALKHTTDTKACVIGAGASADAAKMFKDLFPEAKKAFLIVDPRTYAVAGESVEKQLTEAGVVCVKHVLGADGKPFTVGGIKGPVKVELVGSSVPVEFRCEGDKLTIKPPALAPAAAPCESAWTYRVTAILNDRS